MHGCWPQWSPAAANTCQIPCGETSPSSKAWFLTLVKNKQLQAPQPGGSPPHSSWAEVTACSLWETQSHLNQLGLQRQGSKVGHSAPRSTPHIHHGCMAHTDGYHGMAGTWQLIKPPYRSCTLGSGHAWSHSGVGFCWSTLSCSRYRATPAPLPGWWPQHRKGFLGNSGLATSSFLSGPALALFVLTCPSQLWQGQAWREDMADICSCLTRSPQFRSTTGTWWLWNKHRWRWVESGMNSSNRILG